MVPTPLRRWAPDSASSDLAVERRIPGGFPMHQASSFPNFVARIFVLAIEMLAGRAEGGAIAERNEFDDITNAAAAIEEITTIFFHDTVPKSIDRASRLAWARGSACSFYRVQGMRYNSHLYLGEYT